ncbi:glycosyltransferase [Microbacterium gorillae]|uniref:glycosyltransferase n=1 Tax=Microbacterium gorillae TaxID=1231063 RepID=UPI0005910A00|nr:glycosyltransferase [Microbacterium gorillae]
MRVAIITESFLPHMNGVTRSGLEIAAHLDTHGHEALIIAPAAPGTPTAVGRTRVVAVPSVPLPGYASVRVGAASTARITRILDAFAPDVVHLASPFALGWRGVQAAGRLGLPVVAAYQTDVVAYAERYRLGATTTLAEAHITRLHRRATLTLAPSTASERQLRELGVDRVRRWGRGVDTGRFDPAHRSETWRTTYAPGQVVIGYVGRLAAEKQVADLHAVGAIPGTRLVIVGDGPERAALERALPDAVFLGHRDGAELATAIASFDVFVHPGESETFGQTLQEAHASGVPVVATGRGGPVDLVRSSNDGWLYRPGDLADLRARVLDLVGDESKRRAFGAAGRAAVAGRSWTSVCDDLLDRFAEARDLQTVDAQRRAPRTVRPEPRPSASPRRWRSFIALGDSLTEGLCDPGADGQLRGWADRLALLLASRDGLDYANLAVRSRRVRDVAGEQLSAARRLHPDLVAILIGANDLAGVRADPTVLAASLEDTVRRLRADGADVLLVTPFLPGHRAAGVFSRRFARFATAVVGIAERTGAILLDTDLTPELAEPGHWGADLVHLSPRGHRLLAYRAAERLGVPDASVLAGLDDAFHDGAPAPTRAAWWREHALPWAWRRVRGRRAGDGLTAKHDRYIHLRPSTPRRTRSDA